MITAQHIFSLDEDLERFEDRDTPLTADERIVYAGLREQLKQAQIAYYAQGRRRSPFSMITAIETKRLEPSWAVHPYRVTPSLTDFDYDGSFC